MGNEKQLNIDSIAKELHEVTKMIEKLKTRKHELELTITFELDKRSSDSNWATRLVGSDYEIVRTAKNHINPDDLRHAIGEWIDPDEFDKLIREETKKIVIEPEKVLLTEVNKLKTQGGILADQIEKVTRKTSGSIRVKNTGVSDDIITK